MSAGKYGLTCDVLENVNKIFSKEKKNVYNCKKKNVL